MSPHLRLFGPPALVDGDGRPLSFRTRKQLALLVYLVLEGRQHPAPRELLLEFFWPAVEPQRGRHSLSQALSSIRSRLGPGAVTRDRHTVQLLQAVSTDLDRLEASDLGPAALERPLDELDRVGSASFGHWVDAERERCRVAVKAVLARQMDEARAQGDVNRVYERAAHLYRIDPLSSAAVHALAEQLLQDGDTPATCRLIRSYCARVESEVGGPPSADLLRLLRRIEAGAIRPPVGLPVEATYRLARAEVFVGREAELARLEALWNQARRGKLVTCLVAGPAGIGKTSLLRRFAMSVTARGGTALEVACQEIGRTIPFAAVSDLIQVLARDPAVSGTDPRWLAEASRVSPSLRAAYPGIPEAPPVPAESVRVRIAEAVLRMSGAVTEERAALMVIDDIGHLDPASRDVLHLLLQRACRLPLLVAASAPTTAAQSLTSTSSTETPGLEWSESIALPPLAPGLMRQAVAGMAGENSSIPSELVDEVTALSAGNPYIAEMLLSDWGRNGRASLLDARLRGQPTPDSWSPPAMMKKMFERQYQGLNGSSEQIVNLLAVSKRELSLKEICTLVGQVLPHTAKSALPLVERGILRVSNQGLSFKNQLHRDFVYGNMSRDTQRLYHSQMGMQWSERATPGDFRYSLEGAYHLQRAGMKGEAVSCLTRGAKEAIQRGAAKEAEIAINQHFAMNPQAQDPRLDILLAESALAQGKHRDALRRLDHFDAGAASSELATRTMVLRAEALQRGGLADSAHATAVAHSALKAAETLQDDELVLRSLLVTAEVASGGAEWKVVESVENTATAMAQRSTDPYIRASATVASGFCLMALGRATQAAKRFSDAVAAFRSLARDADLRRALNGLGMCQTSIGEWSGAVTSFLEAVTLASQIGDVHGEAILWDNLAVLYEDLAWFEEAVHARRKAFRVARSAPMASRDITILSNASSLAMTIGSFTEASRFLQEALELARHTHSPLLDVTVLIALANLDIARAEHSSAWAWAQEAIATSKKNAIDSLAVADFERIRRHFLWATRGYDAMIESVASSRHTPAPLRESQQLELSAFSDWIELQEGRGHTASAAIQRMVERGIFGAIAHLVAVNTYPGEMPPREPGESSARLVIRSFRTARQRVVPTTVDAPP